MINDLNMYIKINKMFICVFKILRLNFWILLCIVKGFDYGGRKYFYDSY